MAKILNFTSAQKMRGEVTITHLFTPQIGQILKSTMANVSKGVK